MASARYMPPGPSSLDGFERFVAWTYRERAAGRYACFRVVPRRMHVAAGLFQARRLEPTFRRAEWGFALGEAFWGSGMFSTPRRSSSGSRSRPPAPTASRTRVAIESTARPAP